MNEKQTYAVLFDCGRNYIEFGFYEIYTEKELLSGKILYIGATISEIRYSVKQKESYKEYRAVSDFYSGIKIIQNLIIQNFGKEILQNIGYCIHRVVHGGNKYFQAIEDSQQVQSDIIEFYKLAPLHNPHNLQGIVQAKKVFPEVKHIICFDTAFHQTISEVAKRYPLPERLYKEYKIMKYGFHGLSHEYVLFESSKILNKNKPNLISIHLGEGASICAIQKGRSVETSMGFTPTGGLMMTTRCGDIDPEIPIYLQKEGLSAAEIEDIILRESGLLGVAQKTFVKDVFDNYGKDDRCTLAVDMYVYRIVKYIGFYYILLNGNVDAICFTGNISVEFPLVRQKVAEKLQCIGVKIDKNKNANLKNNGVFNKKDSKIKLILIIPNEFVSMLRQAKRLLKK